MVYALMVVVVVVLATVVLVARRRPWGTDLSSVRSYHSALGTIEHVVDRNEGAPLQVMGPPGTTRSPRDPAQLDHLPGPAGPTASVPPVPVRGNPELPDPGVPLVFDDAHPLNRTRRGEGSDLAPVPRRDRAERHALDSMNHRRWRGTTVAIAVAVVALFGVLAYVGSRRSGPNHHHAAVTSSATRTTRPVAGGHSTGSTKAKGKGKGKTTTTTLPTQLVAVTSTTLSATYSVPSASYQVALDASGPCWVLAKAMATGDVLWTGTLPAGSHQLIKASGPVAVEFGSPTVTLAIDNVPVVLPTPLHTPFTASFVPVTTAGGTAPTTTSTPATTTTTAGTPAAVAG